MGRQKRPEIYPEDIMLVHDIIVRNTGGHTGVKHQGQLESLPALMHYETGVNQKAAVILVTLIQGHVFNDGNKRTGHAVMEAFLNNDQKYLTATDEEIKSFTKEVAQGLLAKQQIINWIVNHTRRAE